jgi:hypothetical protein
MMSGWMGKGDLASMFLENATKSAIKASVVESHGWH